MYTVSMSAAAQASGKLDTQQYKENNEPKYHAACQDEGGRASMAPFAILPLCTFDLRARHTTRSTMQPTGVGKCEKY